MVEDKGLNKFYTVPMQQLLTRDFSSNRTNIQEMRAENSNSVTIHYKVVALLSHQLLASSFAISPDTDFIVHSAAMPIKTSLSCVAPPN